MSAAQSTQGQNNSYVPISAAVDTSGHSSASSTGSIGNTIVFPPGVPGGDSFALGGSSGIVRQIFVGVIVFVIATYALKHFKKV